MTGLRFVGLAGLLVLALFLAACQSEEKPLAFETIAQGNFINYREERPALIVVARDDEVDALSQNLLAEDSRLVSQLRTLDYKQFLAILVLQGQKPTSEYSITVQQITSQSNRVTLRAKLTQPEPKTATMQSFTSPYHLIKIMKATDWEQQINFTLIANDKVVVQTSHILP